MWVGASARRIPTKKNFQSVGAEEAVSKLELGGPSALLFLFQSLPGALPQAGMDRAFGALNPIIKQHLKRRRRALYQPRAKP